MAKKMRNSRFLIIAAGIVLLPLLFGAFACVKMEPTDTGVLDYEPLIVVSVKNTVPPSPGGPTIVITLENVSTEIVTLLDVTLHQTGAPNPRAFIFEVSDVRPLLPGDKITSASQLFGGNWGDGIPYFLDLSGKVKSGAAFSYDWAGPEIGKMLDVEVELGTGTVWAQGVVLSEARFVVGLADRDYPGIGPEVLAKEGEPCIYFSGVFTNNSGRGGYVSFWTTPQALTYAGIPGRAEYYIPAGQSQAFKIPLTYDPKVTTIAVGSQIMDMPSP